MSEAHGAALPSAWVRRFAPLIRPQGRVLDLAAGSGRHTALLRELGYRITAVDRDIAALTEGFAGDPGCLIRAIDLEDGTGWTLGADYDGIIVTNYLNRLIFPALSTALGPGGILIYETFAAGNERFGRPGNPNFLLRPGELFDEFHTALTVIAFEQGTVDAPRPAVIQRLAAAKGGWPPRLPA